MNHVCRKKEGGDQITVQLNHISKPCLNPLDLLPYDGLPEKIIDLVLSGTPAGLRRVTAGLTELAENIAQVNTADLNVIVFGGGTGLANIIGGDSKKAGWHKQPFNGLKKLFPKIKSIVCVTDDGGSTGELLKDSPVIALGDIRHVLLSSINEEQLNVQYGLNRFEALAVIFELSKLFNYRFSQKPSSLTTLITQTNIDLQLLPRKMADALTMLLETLFANHRLSGQLNRSHCLGNLLLLAAIYQTEYLSNNDNSSIIPPQAILNGIRKVAELIGAEAQAVLPCTTTPACLKILYNNGVLITGEDKSSYSRRKCPVREVDVEFSQTPHVPVEILKAVEDADIILFAPGSLYTSIIPVLKTPGIACAIRKQQKALKILIANLWVQQGETDLVCDNAKRRFYVSDLIRAYHQNIPGGVERLFNQVLSLGLQEIPGNILQNYAIENKVPIYLDREHVTQMGFTPLEANIHSKSEMVKRKIIQHDPASVAHAIKTLWVIRSQLTSKSIKKLPPCKPNHQQPLINTSGNTPSQRLTAIGKRLDKLAINQHDQEVLLKIFWNHRDIPLTHLDYFKGVKLIERHKWQRGQTWDKIFSFYDPEDSLIKMHWDLLEDYNRFEFGFLVALGQSLLGNYAAQKQKVLCTDHDEVVGKIFKLTLRPCTLRNCFFNTTALDQYLRLARMNRSTNDQLVYSRLINGKEGFTPPGLLLGLTYAWYLDNRFASNIENKMSIINMEMSDLIPEQINVYKRRQGLVDFFRTTVFREP